MVVRAVSAFRHEAQGVSCFKHSCPPAWDPSEDLRCIATTFQYLQSSGTATIFSLHLLFPSLTLRDHRIVHCEHINEQLWVTPFVWVLIKWKNCFGGRLVLGLHLSERGSAGSPRTVWRHVSHAGQQSSTAHVGPVGEDPLWAHQRAHRVQQGLLLARQRLSWAASPADLPRCSQPHTALHGFKPGVQWHTPRNQARSSPGCS